MRNTISILTLLVLMTLSACVSMPSEIIIPKHMPPAPKIKKPINVALVLGGGGARCFAHIGVLKVLQHAHIPIDLIVGASAGSVIGSLYADSGNAKHVENILQHAGFWDFADLSALGSLKSIMTGAEFQVFMFHHMQARRFKDLHIPFVAVASDLTTGDVVRLNSGPVIPAVTASAAIPGLLRPVKLYGHTLVDGAMADPVPVDVAKRYHPKIIIAVDVAKSLEKSQPFTAYGIYERAYEISWRRLSQLAEHNADVVIHPNVGAVGTFNLNHKRELIAAGEKAARKALPQIRKLLRDKHIRTS